MYIGDEGVNVNGWAKADGPSKSERPFQTRRPFEPVHDDSRPSIKVKVDTPEV